MHKIINAIKTVLLALVLSFGLSYVYAWTAPTVTAPNGNVSAPINTSATLQQKSGDFTVANFVASTVSVGATINTNAITAPQFCIGVSCITAWPAAGIPTGAVMFFNLASCPPGWLPANGTSGTPDLRGEFIRGLDGGRGVDAGRTLGTWQTDMLKSHTHTSKGEITSTPPLSTVSQVLMQTNDTTVKLTVNTTATGGTETRPRNVALLACIKS